MKGLTKVRYTKDKNYDACPEGKQTTSHPLNLLYLDLIDSHDIASSNGIQSLLIVDDYNRCIWILFLRNKY